MLCENAYYDNVNNVSRKRLLCSSEKKAKDDLMFGNKCPLIYFCQITERYENTADMFNCIYRRKK